MHLLISGIITHPSRLFELPGEELSTLGRHLKLDFDFSLCRDERSIKTFLVNGMVTLLGHDNSRSGFKENLSPTYE